MVITWTVDECRALSDEFTPGYKREKWYNYDKNFATGFKPIIRPGAPSLKAKRLGQWFPTTIADKKIICFKSELHLNQDGITDANGHGYASLPVKDLFKQVIADVKPEYIITTGTAGGVFPDHDLGDVVITRGAKFKLHNEFKNAPFNNSVFKSGWNISDAYISLANDFLHSLANHLIEFPILAPTIRHTGTPYSAPVYNPDIKLDNGIDLPEFHPILTTDFFEFGTSVNGLEREGCAVEMGDAVLGLVCSELQNPPKWLVVRNLSDPQINGKLPKSQAEFWAVYYYEQYGYWTSIMSAIATWAVIAGI